MADTKVEDLIALASVTDDDLLYIVNDPLGSPFGNHVTVANLMAGNVLVDGSRALTANWNAGAFKITANQLESTVVAGTAPLVIASTDLVTNLNADRLDGNHAAAFLKTDGTAPLTAAWDAGSFSITALTLHSDVATGTAPLAVASTTLVTNLNADTVDGLHATAFVTVDGTTPLTGNWDVGTFTVTALRFVSDQVTGTAPFTVASTTVVTNLNADLLDGQHASAFGDVSAAAVIADNTIVRGDGGTKGVQGSGITVDDTDNVSGVGTFGLAGDITNYEAVNDGNPELRLGATDAEELHVQAVYDAVAQTLSHVLFQTDVLSAVANKGLFRFNVDGTAILDIDDGGIDLDTGKALSINGTDVITATTLGDGVTASSLTSVGTLVALTANGAVDFSGAASVVVSNGVGPVVAITGEIAVDTDGDGSTVTQGVFKYFDGTRTMVAFGVDGYPSTDNDVMAFDSATNAVTWQAQVGAGGSSEWTDLAGVLHPADSGGAQDIVAGGTAVLDSARASFYKAGVALSVQNTTNAVSNQVAIFHGGDRGIAANNDEAYFSLSLDDDTEVQTEFARLTWVATDIATASKDGAVEIAAMVANTLTTLATINGTGLDIATGDDYQIGGTSVLNATTLGGAVKNSNLQNFGTVTALTMSTTGVLTLPSTAAPVVDATGEFAHDTTITDFTGGALIYHSGAEVFGQFSYHV